MYDYPVVQCKQLSQSPVLYTSVPAPGVSGPAQCSCSAVRWLLYTDSGGRQSRGSLTETAAPSTPVATRVTVQ